VLRRIGLTGGIGSGKSTAACMFQNLGVPVLDLDAVGHTVTAPGSEGLNALVAAFGPRVLGSDDSLDRTALARYCFSDAGRTAMLNSILHPLIWQYEEQWLAQQSGDYAVIEASVLLESGGAGRMERLVVVMADEALRLQRVLQRGNHDAAAFKAIIARQCDDAMRKEQADYLIDNNATLESLRRQVEQVHRILMRLPAGQSH